MNLVRRAKKEGIPVSAEVTPHHFCLTEEAVSNHGTNAKMNPPLRSRNDLEAVLEAISDGTIDAIASDHAPHDAASKALEFQKAPFGIIGLETSVSIGLDKLVHTHRIGLDRFIELYSLNPAAILGIPRSIRIGAEANLTVFDPSKKIRVDASRFQSKSRNTPFDGYNLNGAPAMTIVKGQLVWQA
jgi:dihydroorotase